MSTPFKKKALASNANVSQDVITKGGNIIVTISSSKCRVFGWLLGLMSPGVSVQRPVYMGSVYQRCHPVKVWFEL